MFLPFLALDDKGGGEFRTFMSGHFLSLSIVVSLVDLYMSHVMFMMNVIYVVPCLDLNLLARHLCMGYIRLCDEQCDCKLVCRTSLFMQDHISSLCCLSLFVMMYCFFLFIG